MPTATGSQSYLAMIKQDPAAPTVVPATPLLQKVNFASSDLGVAITNTTSNHIRDDRATTDLAITGLDIAGGYEFEMQFENSLLDELILGFLWAETWEASGSLVSTAQNGVFYQPFYMERGHTDIDQYLKFVGMACNVWTMTLADQALVTGAYSFVGLSSTMEDVITTGATYTEPTLNPIFSTVSNIPEISIGGVPVESCKIKELTMEVNNNVTPKTGLGTLGACETNAHRLSLTGTMTLYFEDETMYNNLLTGTAFAVTWTLTDNDSNSYKFTLPRVKLNTDDIPVTGVDDDVMENAGFEALYDDTTGAVIIVEKSATPTP